MCVRERGPEQSNLELKVKVRIWVEVKFRDGYLVAMVTLGGMLVSPHKDTVASDVPPPRSASFSAITHR